MYEKLDIYDKMTWKKGPNAIKKWLLVTKWQKKSEGGRHSSLFVTCFLNSIGTSTYGEEVPVIDSPLMMIYYVYHLDRSNILYNRFIDYILFCKFTTFPVNIYLYK